MFPFCKKNINPLYTFVNTCCFIFLCILLLNIFTVALIYVDIFLKTFLPDHFFAKAWCFKCNRLVLWWKMIPKLDVKIKIVAKYSFVSSVLALSLKWAHLIIYRTRMKYSLKLSTYTTLRWLIMMKSRYFEFWLRVYKCKSLIIIFIPVETR